jgi:hypothetical protein
MNKLAAAFAACAAALICAGVASANLSIGVNDDAGKDATISPWFYSTMQSEGLTTNALSLRWDDTQPTTVPDVAAVDQALVKAKASGVTVELDLYPLHSQIFTGGQRCAPSSDPQACGNTAEIQAWGAWTAEVAETFPTVHEFVVMNECNQPLFVNPQWDTAGGNQSAEICGRALAAAYDALHGVSSQNFVWGVGLSPRGNDNPNAASDSSTTPVKFLGDLGAWFKSFAAATHRTAPLMDGFDFHPYPVPQTLPFATGYANPNEASIANLPRIYQAFYSGFAGTPQPTIGQQQGGGLPVSLNEVGIQTTTGDLPGYVGTETSATAAGGVIGQFATEDYQAQWYQQMLNYVACDPNIQVVNIFHLIDEPSLAGWQSGLYYYSPTDTPQAKESAQTVKSFIAGGMACTGGMHAWTPAGVSAATTTTTTTTTPVVKVTAPPVCAGKAPSRTRCLQYIAVARKQLLTLKKEAARAKGKSKTHVLALIALEQRRIGAALAAYKKLSR